MDETDDAVLTLWEAYYKLEPWGGEYERHSQQMELADAAFAVQINSSIPKNRTDLKYKPRDRRKFYPFEYAGEMVSEEKPKANVVDQCLSFATATIRNYRKK